MTRTEAAKLARKAKRIPPIKERFWSKVDVREDSECWPWMAAVRNKKEGYGAFWFKGRHHPAPRIAVYLSTGVLHTNLCICHKCDNPSCCNPRHLFVATNVENNADKVAKLRHAYGERNGASKMTDEKVKQLRKLRKSHSLKELGEMFGIDFTTAGDICRRKSWNHI